MSMLEEIFKTNPQLLNEPEVQSLIKHCEDTYAKTVKIAKNYQNFHDEVLEIIVYSEICLINGTPAKDALQKIEDAITKF
jgi:hypothetical protein